MKAVRIGYDRCSIDRQDLTAQRAALVGLGMDPKRIHTDHALLLEPHALRSARQAVVRIETGRVLRVWFADGRTSLAQLLANCAWMDGHAVTAEQALPVYHRSRVANRPPTAAAS